MKRLPLSWCLPGLVAVGLWCALAPAAGAEPNATSTPSMLVAEWEWWEETKAWFSHQASNRSRVVQFATIGMVVALLILYSASNRKR